MATTTKIKAVFLGLAEVRLPLRLLPPERQPIVADLAYKAITELECSDEEKAEIMISIGCIDAQYAMQEVTLEIIEEKCCLKRNEEVILRHKVRDVIFGKELPNKTGNVIYITRSENFGRAAVLLMMKKSEMVFEILTAL